MSDAIPRLSATAADNAKTAGADDKVYSARTVTVVVAALRADGISSAHALERAGLDEKDLHAPATRISLNQILQCYATASRLSPDALFAYRTGLHFHLSTYGMFGFAMLSSTNFRQTMRFALQYQQLVPQVIEPTFREKNGFAAWIFEPAPLPIVDKSLYQFIVELHVGVFTSLHRDVMGPGFVPREIRLRYRAPEAAQSYSAAFGCAVLFDQAENAFEYDRQWLDRVPELGNELTYREILALCDQLLGELNLKVGIAGQVRQVLLLDLLRPTTLDAVARRLKIPPRTLRRRLHEEGTSYRALLDELRMQVSLRYLRETQLTVEEIAAALGFSDAAGFRRAFRRWTRRTPIAFRDDLAH
jgi:AraC-like DNA-binding protein